MHMLLFLLFLFLDRFSLNLSVRHVCSTYLIKADPSLELINFTLLHLVVPQVADQCATYLISGCFRNGAYGGFIQLQIETSYDFLLIDA